MQVQVQCCRLRTAQKSVGGQAGVAVVANNNVIARATIDPILTAAFAIIIIAATKANTSSAPVPSTRSLAEKIWRNRARSLAFDRVAAEKAVASKANPLTVMLFCGGFSLLLTAH